MKYRVTKRMEEIVEQVHVLRTLVEPGLDLASTAAQDEWNKLLARLPAIADLEGGSLAMSEGQLEEARAKIARFAAILRAGGTRVVGVSISPGGPTRGHA